MVFCTDKMRINRLIIVLVSAVVLVACGAQIRASGQQRGSSLSLISRYIKEKSDIREGGSGIYSFEGTKYIISVAPVSVGTKTESACKTVGSAKAKSEMLSYMNGSEISSYRELRISEVSSETLLSSTATVRQEYVEVIREKVLGMINQTAPLGGWYSADGSVYYYAIYKIIE